MNHHKTFIFIQFIFVNQLEMASDKKWCIMRTKIVTSMIWGIVRFHGISDWIMLIKCFRSLFNPFLDSLCFQNIYTQIFQSWKL